MQSKNDGMRVALEALRTDEAKWRESVPNISRAATTARTLVLGPEALGMAAESRGVILTYSGLQEKLVKLLEGATQEFTKIADTLRQTAVAYEAVEQANRRRFDGLGKRNDN